MPKLVSPKSWKAIRALADGCHAVGHVPGLRVQVDGQARSWLLRYSYGGREPEMGLGSLREVGLQEAIDAATAARKLLRAGVDPIEDRRARKQERALGAQRTLTFAAATKQYLAKHSGAWRNPKHRQQWVNTLATYAGPTLGALPVDRIETAHVLAALEPIWATKTETATRVRQRIENVLDYCTAAGLRRGENPARWKGHLENLLAAPTKIAKVEHHEALPWRELPAFMPKLRKVDGMGARALEFAIYTAARSGEVRGATWDEIDLKRALWTIPAERMKAHRQHVVPLPPRAVALLRKLPRFDGVPYVFASTRGSPLSDMTLSAVLRRMKVDATVHGMRSSFRDWSSESTNYPREVAEMALAHAIPSAVEAAYRRGDLLAKRTQMMLDWEAFVAKRGGRK